MTTRTQRIAKLKSRFPSRNPSRKAAAQTIVSKDLCLHIATEVLKRTPRSAARWIRAAILPALPIESAWHRELRNLAGLLADIATGASDDRLTAQVFKAGNSKLSFWSFSALPALTCPGAGACLQWCYSFRSWRHVSPFTRQLLNTVLLRHRRDIIRRAFQQLPDGATVRLYVDGDFDSVQTLALWMRLLRSRPDCQAYGYTKSWELFERYGSDRRFPDNYCVNLSSGSVHDTPENRQRMVALQCDDGASVVRGRFVAVPLSADDARTVRALVKAEKDRLRAAGDHKAAQSVNPYQFREYHRAVRESGARLLAEKVFSCPGKCDSCAGRHLCGDRSAPVTIAIGIH